MTTLLLALGVAAVVRAQNSSPHEVTSYGVVYTEPGMRNVHVRPDLTYSTSSGRKLKFDFYQAAGKSGLPPVVIFVNGVGDLPNSRPEEAVRRWGQYTSWPKLVASRGMAAVTYQAENGSTAQNLKDLISELKRKSGDLRIDSSKIALWACSANCSTAVPFAMDEAGPELKCAVFYYGTGEPKSIRTDLPVMLQQAGLDQPSFNTRISALANRAREAQAPWTLGFLPNAHHAFDCLDDTDESFSAIKQTLSFLEDHLLATALHHPTDERLALSYFFGQEFSKAAPVYKRILQRNPTDTTAAIRYGICLSNLGQSEEAVRVLETALAKSPESAEAYNSLGNAFSAMHDYAKAEAAYEKYVAVATSDSRAFYALGTAELFQKKYAEGIEHLKRSVELFPDGYGAHYNLACAFALTGDKAKALDSLAAAVDHGFRDKAGLQSDPDLESLRSDPRYKLILDRLGGQSI